MSSPHAKNKQPWQQGGGPSHQQVQRAKPAAVATIFAMIAILAVLTVLAATQYHGSTGLIKQSDQQELQDKRIHYSVLVDKQYPIRKAPRNPNAVGDAVASVVVANTVYVNEYQLRRDTTLSEDNYKKIYYAVITRVRSHGKLTVTRPRLVKTGSDGTPAIRGRIVNTTRGITNNVWLLFHDKHEVQINCQYKVTVPCRQVLKNFRWK